MYRLPEISTESLRQMQLLNNMLNPMLFISRQARSSKRKILLFKTEREIEIEKKSQQNASCSCAPSVCLRQSRHTRVFHCSHLLNDFLRSSETFLGNDSRILRRNFLFRLSSRKSIPPRHIEFRNRTRC